MFAYQDYYNVASNTYRIIANTLIDKFHLSYPQSYCNFIYYLALHQVN